MKQAITITIMALLLLTSCTKETSTPKRVQPAPDKVDGTHLMVIRRVNPKP